MELTIEQALQKGITAHKAGKLQNAERLYRAILKSQPSHPDANHNLGVLTTSMWKFDEALPFFKAALEANPKIEQFWLSYIDALIKDDKYEQARELFEKAKRQGLAGENLNIFERQLTSEVQRADAAGPSKQQLNDLSAHYQEGRFSDAQQLATSMTRAFPIHPFGWKVLGAILSQTGTNTEALKANEKTVELSPQDPEAHNNFGITLKEVGRVTESEVNFAKAIDLKPDFAEAHNNLGITHQELNRLDEAEARLRQAVRLKPNFAEAQNNLGFTLASRGKLDEAEQSCRRGILINAKHARAYFILGTTLKKLGRLVEAEANDRKAIIFRPGYADAYNNLGLLLRELNNPDGAEVNLKYAIILNPFLPEAHNNLGVTLQELGQLSGAERSLGLAIALQPELAEAHNNLGVTLKARGRVVEAEQRYKQALVLDPQYSEAAFKLGILLFECGRYKEAAKQFEATNHENSSLYSIRCSYLLDSEYVFLEKLNLLKGPDAVNAVVGSLVNCINIRRGTRRSNPFCSDPLLYVITTHLPSLYNFEKVFGTPARRVLLDEEQGLKDQGHLTNGKQTAGNIFSRKEFREAGTENIIRCEIDKYKKSFRDSREGFINQWPERYELFGWLIEMKNGGNLSAHMHDSGWITGSVYINVPAKSNANSGDLVLCVGDEENSVGENSGDEKIINTTTGRLCLFPSSLRHYTVPFQSLENRVVLAFDVIPIS